MPVNLKLTVPDLPTPPGGYLLVALEVRDREPAERLPPERGLFPHSTEGYERAARLFFDRAHSACRLACVAWFADRPLKECEDGRERLASVFDPVAGEWSEWVPEGASGGCSPRIENRHRKAFRKLASVGRGDRDIGDGVAGGVVEPEHGTRGEAA